MSPSSRSRLRAASAVRAASAGSTSSSSCSTSGLRSRLSSHPSSARARSRRSNHHGNARRGSGSRGPSSGCGPCEEICPEVFEVVDDVANVKVDEVPAEQYRSCKEAAESCPSEAISLEE